VSLFVTFEGPEGSGKSTQVRLVASLLTTAGHNVVETREPGGTSLGERIRDLLLDPNNSTITPVTEALLMTAARSQHVADVLRPAICRSQIILCDRYTDSTLAYQGAGRGLSIAELEELQDFAIGGIRPHLTVLLDIPVETGLSRRELSGTPLNRLDLDERAFHERVRSWYLHAARQEPDRWLVLDARKAQDELAGLICQRIIELIAQRSRTAEQG
jgi:dTMP kinase